MAYVFSTLSAPVEYTFYTKGGGDIPIPTHSIRVEGGAGIINKHMITPQGAIATSVTDEELAQLEKHDLFKLHKKNGFVTISKSKKDGEKVAAANDMAIDEGSRQASEVDFKKPPKSGPVEKD